MLPPRRHLAAVAVLAALAALTAGCGQPRSQPAPGPGPTAAPTAPVLGPGELPAASVPPTLAAAAGPTTVVDGAPMGYRRDAAGAKAAGVSFSRLNEALVLMSESAVTAAWRAMASQSTADGLVADVAARLGALRQRWPAGSLTYRVAPIAVRATEAGPAEMRVDVWYVGVVAGANLPTYEEWMTDTYQLVWERDDWRVAALSDTPGPRPAPGSQPPAGPAEIEARLVGFEAVR